MRSVGENAIVPLLNWIMLVIGETFLFLLEYLAINIVENIFDIIEIGRQFEYLFERVNVTMQCIFDIFRIFEDSS